MLIITGRTYPHRDALKAMGASWDGGRWELFGASDADRASLSKMLGVIVRDVPDLTPINDDDEDDEPGGSWIDNIVAEIEAGNANNVQERSGTTFQYGDDMTYLNHFAFKNPLSYFGFSSLARMADFVERIKPSVEADDRRNSGWSNREKFTGTRNMIEALELAYEGWQEGADAAAKIADEIGVAYAVQRRKQYNVAGGRVNVGRMLAGDPRNMVTRFKQQGSRVVTIFVETAINAEIKAENAKLRAACIAGLIDVIEQRGYSCELVATNMTVHRLSPVAQLAVRLKSAGEALNINDVIFALGHPSFERRFNFACIGATEELRAIWSGMGSSSVAFNEKYPPAKNEFYVPQFSGKTQMKIRGDNDIDRALSLLGMITPDGLKSFVKGK